MNRPKVLLITSRLPYPPFGGDKVRVFNFIQYLSRNYQITLVSFLEGTEDAAAIEKLKEYCVRIETVRLPVFKSYLNCLRYAFSSDPFQVSFYRSRRMEQKLREIAGSEKFDYVFVHLLRMAHYAEKLSGFKILDLTDAISLSLRRSLSFRSHVFFLFYLLEWLKVRAYESRVIRRFDKNILISKMDQQAHPAFQNAGNIELVANGVDFDFFHPRPVDYDRNKIVCLGNFHSFPNRDSVNYFFKQILPIVKQSAPEIKLYVVGINPPAKLKKMQGENLVVTGTVEDIRKVLSDAGAMVCPLRVAAGIQNKILESMALGIPVVTTSLGAGWMDAAGREAVMIADTPQEFAAKLLELLQSPETRQNLSRRGREYVIKNYDWRSNISKLERLMPMGDK